MTQGTIHTHAPPPTPQPPPPHSIVSSSCQKFLCKSEVSVYVRKLFTAKPLLSFTCNLNLEHSKTGYLSFRCMKVTAFLHCFGTKFECGLIHLVCSITIPYVFGLLLCLCSASDTLILRFLVPDFPLLVRVPFLSSALLDGMTFPFLSDGNPLWTPSNQATRHVFFPKR